MSPGLSDTGMYAATKVKHGVVMGAGIKPFGSINVMDLMKSDRNQMIPMKYRDDSRNKTLISQKIS